MLEVILKSISLANAPALTERELGDRSRDWAEVLFVAVPEDRINDAYIRAFKDHGSNFPLTAYEVKTAWDRIADEEVDATTKSRAEEVAAIKTAALQCPRCDGTEMEIVYDIDGAVLGARKCDHRPVTEGEPMFKPKARAASNVIPITQEASQ